MLDLEGSGDKTEVVVRFPEKGEKRLLLAWAPLEKVGGESSGDSAAATSAAATSAATRAAATTEVP